MNLIDRGIVFDASVAPPHERCSAFTSLIRLADGTLICGFKLGPEKLCATDRMVLMQSADEGRTWGRLFDGFDTTFQGTPGSYSGGYLVELDPTGPGGSGRLLISLHWIDRSDPTRPLSNPETAGVLPMKYLLAESRDAGRSWSAPHEISLAPHPGTNPTGAIVRLHNGQLMLSYESWKEWDAVEGEQSANVKRSADSGATWGEPITMASDPAKQLYYWDNRVTVQPGTGRPLAALWTHQVERGVDAPIHLVRGEPDGTRWSTPQSTPIQGQVAAPLFLDENRLLLVYVHRHDPPSMRAVLSDDAGKTWRLDEEVTLYESGQTRQAGMDQSRNEAEYWDDMTRWTFGHPKAVRLNGGQVYVVFYAPPDPAGPANHSTPQAADTPPLSIHGVRLQV